MRRAIFSLLLCAAASSLAGCCALDVLFAQIPFAKGYDSDFSKWGTGEQVITPKGNDPTQPF
jgi:hypothetical protein